MGHCPYDELADLDTVLEQVRTWDDVNERSPGVFYIKRLPFLHFHSTKEGERWADARCGKSWGERLTIERPSTAATRRAFLIALRRYHAETLAAVAPRRSRPAGSSITP